MNAIAALMFRSPSEVVACPSVRVASFGALFVPLTSLLPLAPPTLALAVVAVVASVSAEIESVPASIIASVSRKAVVVTKTVATPMPAPALACWASPNVTADTLFVAAIESPPPAATGWVPLTEAPVTEDVAVDQTNERATAASYESSPWPALPIAVEVSRTRDADARLTSPPASTPTSSIRASARVSTNVSASAPATLVVSSVSGAAVVAPFATVQSSSAVGSFVADSRTWRPAVTEPTSPPVPTGAIGPDAFAMKARTLLPATGSPSSSSWLRSARVVGRLTMVIATAMPTAVLPVASTPARFATSFLSSAVARTSCPAETVARSSMNASDSVPMTTTPNTPSITVLLPPAPERAAASTEVSVSACIVMSRAAATSARSSM